MTTSLVYDLLGSTDVSAERIGGKAFALMRLAKECLPVPTFYVIAAEALRQTIDLDECDASEKDVHQLAAEIRQRIDNATLAPQLVSELQNAHQACFPTDSLVAVRSSAIAEDGSSHSFAGMYESVLGIRGQEELLAAIKRVWMSAVSPRVIAYRQHQGLPPLDPAMAVVVQQIVDAKCSGVCFTCDPLTGSQSKILVSSVLGLGEGLVSRGFPADTYRIDRETFAINAELADKPERLTIDPQSGQVRTVAVSTGDRQRDSLTRGQVVDLANTVIEIESTWGCPQDVEFCFAQDGSLSILQSRPVTGPTKRNDGDFQEPNRSNHIVWDNSNIIESYSGVTTPMTFSFIRRAYSIVYHCFAEVMGISPRVVEQNQDTFDNMLGLFHGRVYYNLKNWYRLVRMFPGYHYNQDFMESMMGVKASFSLEDQPAQISLWRRWLVEFPALLTLLARSGWNFFRIREIVRRFEEHFCHYHDQWEQIDFDSIKPDELARMYGEMERKMLWNWKAPIINDFYVMVFYGILRKLCVSWCGDTTASLQNGLLCGEGGLKSDEPAKLLMRMTHLARGNHGLKDLIMNQPLESLPKRIAGDSKFAEFNELMTDYLDEFGLRCADELKLESYSYRDQPHRLYKLIREFLASKDAAHSDLHESEQRERKIRQSSERQVNEILSESRSRIIRRFWFGWVLKNARLGVRNRENMRFARTRIYGILRRILRSIGKQFADQNILSDREDIFYLTIDEVWNYVKGTAVTTDLRGLANLRKSEYEAYRKELVPPPADRFETYDLPYHGNSFAEFRAANIGDGSLAGIGCCPGIVRGTTQVVTDPTGESSFDGDILVAERTDPGWVLLYPAFSGILVERGSVLSHSAIVAREMGIPTIVGITGLTRQIQSEQRVVMDGHSGRVQTESDR
jgi:phosphohistidine swiveling domain-containing protein